ncbi:MAG: class I SAM-dependent rRNA methyltransferase [Myxococcales bacterium]|nr:class I SAM-dependent rRNA methyltransferase [Myxococcota bacterium]MDW8280925.1 class I SAM-dependent rRNA methyltransferase [Myxococcales bacterium]
MYPVLKLHKNLAAALRGGHPWVYREALCPFAPLPSGQVVDIHDRTGCFVARGVYDASSPIAVRVFTLDPGEEVDEALLGRRLAAALRSRQGLLDLRTTSAFRLCNGEGDFLPGIVLDVYAEVAVLRLEGEGARALRAPLCRALMPLLEDIGVRTLYERSPDLPGQLLHGPPPPAEVVVREHGVLLAVDIVCGQKTGLFLDQRESRLLVRQVARGLTVWNGFCYTGGFSLQAALGGARSVVSVDTAEPALAAARRNFTLNNLPLDPQRFPFLCEDVFAHLRRGAAMGLTYDLVIVDPPSFAPSQAALLRALPAYQKLLALAMGAVSAGGLLAASSCSSHVSLEAFLTVIGQAASRCRRRCRLLEVRGQPADHPSLPLFPEGRYLKFVLCRLD